MIRVILFFMALAGPVASDVLVAARTIPAQSLIRAEDLLLRNVTANGGVDDPLLLIGMEARVALYAGRPVRPADVGFPAIVDRNEIVPLIYNSGGLYIATEGRSLGRAGIGDIVRVMNLSSRSTVSARIGEDGVAYVSR